MLIECNCVVENRECKHFLGVKNDSNPFDELKEFYFCKAFPEGIPDDIAFGNNKHIKSYPGDHGIRYEKREMKLEFKREDRNYTNLNELLISQCIDCKHKLKSEGCKAFPLEIPEDILLNKHDHQKPYPGDHGIRYEKGR